MPAPYHYQPLLNTPQASQQESNLLLRNENFVSYCNKQVSSRKRSQHKKREPAPLDETFINSVQLQLINELVAGDEEQKPSQIVAEAVKHNDSHTTNHSTGDSQNSSSSAEKAERKASMNEPEGNMASSDSSSESSAEEAGCVPNESLKSFITDSPFSFRNPIFFSVPRDHQ